MNISKWNSRAKRMLKSELVKRGLSTKDLTSLLNADGATETKSSVDSKISRGTFSASFFIHSMHVIGCTRIEIETQDPQPDNQQESEDNN